MSKNSTRNEAAGWGLRLAALALTLLGIVVVFAFRFADNGNQPSAIMWAGVPIIGGLLVSFLLGKIGRFGSQESKWKYIPGCWCWRRLVFCLRPGFSKPVLILASPC